MRSLRHSLLTLVALAIVLLFATAVAWFAGADPLTAGNWSGRVYEALTPWRHALTVLRWVLWATLWWQWERLGQRCFAGETRNARHKRQQWARMRGRMLGGIALVELAILYSQVAGG